MLNKPSNSDDFDVLDAVTESRATLHIGPLSIGTGIANRRIAKTLLAFYEGFPVTLETRWPDFNIELKPADSRFGRFRRQFQIYIEGNSVFSQFRNDLAIPYFDSAVNWSVQVALLRYLVIHAAVIEKNGFGLILPAASGAGKSTLTAALVGEGWRLLSDEVALISLSDGLVWPHPRPISLKNDSIEVIARQYSELTYFKAFDGTPKGRVAYIRTPIEAIAAAMRPVTPRFVIFPRYVSELKERTQVSLEKAESFSRLVQQSQNYERLMHGGFKVLADLVDRCNHYELRYPNLESALCSIEDVTGKCLSR